MHRRKKIENFKNSKSQPEINHLEWPCSKTKIEELDKFRSRSRNFYKCTNLKKKFMKKIILAQAKKFEFYSPVFLDLLDY